MRITATHIMNQQAVATGNAQTQVGQLANEATSGMRVTSPSQDPTAWLAAHRAILRDTLSKGIGTAMQYGTTVLDQTDSALTSIESIVSQVRAIAVQGLNATNGAVDRTALATQVQGLLAGAVAAGNAQAPNGEYLLAGSKSLTAPFDAVGNYTGDASTRSILTSQSTSYAATIPGSALTSAGGGVDVLPLLQQVATALATNNVAGLQGTLTGLTTATTQVGGLRSRVGNELSAFQAADTARQDLQLHLETSASNLVEADAVTVATQLAQASTALTTSQTVAAHVISVLSSASNG